MLGAELNEAEAHVSLRQLVLGDVHAHDRPGLHAELPKERLRDLRIEVANVARRLLVTVLLVRGHGCRGRPRGGTQSTVCWLHVEALLSTKASMNRFARRDTTGQRSRRISNNHTSP